VGLSFDSAAKPVVSAGTRRPLTAPPCPNCGALVVSAEASEYVSDGRIRHRWLCDDCDHDYRTVVKISG